MSQLPDTLHYANPRAIGPACRTKAWAPRLIDSWMHVNCQNCRRTKAWLAAYENRRKELQNKCGPGHQRLWGWFGLSYASWLTLPRVLMHEMPDEWQDRMAQLLEEYDAAFPNCPNLGTMVRATRNGRLTRMPKWLVQYRHPVQSLDEINNCRGGA